MGKFFIIHSHKKNISYSLIQKKKKQRQIILAFFCFHTKDLYYFLCKQNVSVCTRGTALLLSRGAKRGRTRAGNIRRVPQGDDRAPISHIQQDGNAFLHNVCSVTLLTSYGRRIDTLECLRLYLIRRR